MKKLILVCLLLTTFMTNASSADKIELYDLMYKSFIYTNDINHAYEIASKVVQIDPKNITWRKRLAQLCIWLGKQREAFRHYLFIYNQTKDKEIEKILFSFPYQEVVDLKINIYQNELKSGNFTHLKELINLYRIKGYPEKSIKLLEDLYKQYKLNLLLISLLKLNIEFENTPEISKFNKVLYFLTDDERIKLATLYINKRKYNEAYLVLTKTDHLPKNDTYYKLLLTTTIKLKKEQESIKLLHYLNEKGILSLEEFYYLLNYYLKKNDQKTIKKLIKKSISKYKSTEFLYLYINLLLKENKFDEAIQFVKRNKHLFQNEKDYHLLYIQLLIKNQNYQLAKKNLVTFLEKYKENITINELKTVLWIMIDNKSYFQDLLQRYANDYSKKSGLELVSISAFLAIQQIDKAENLARKILKKNLENIDFLLLYSDILNIQTRYEESNYYKLLALKQMKKQKDKESLKTSKSIKNYLRLTMLYKTPEVTEKLFKDFENYLSKDEYEQLLIEYYFHSNQYEKLLYIYNFNRVIK